jgi:hypothetical protein
MWWIKLILLITITIGVTALIVWGFSWIDKNKEKHPELYKQRGLIRLLLWIIFSGNDLH